MKEFGMNQFRTDATRRADDCEGRPSQSALLYVGSRYQRLIEADIALFGLNFELICAATIDEACQHAKRRPFGALIIDDVLVVAEGSAAVKRVRAASAENAAIPVRVVALKDQAKVRSILADTPDISIIPEDETDPAGDPFGFDRLIG